MYKILVYTDVLTTVYSLNSADLSFMIRTLQCQCTADFVL